MKHLTYIEPLECRIAPATIVNPYTVTYQDYQTQNGSLVQPGNTVVVTISKPLFTSPTAAANILGFTATDGTTTLITSPFSGVYAGNGTAQFLFDINLLGRTDAQGMNISVKVIPQAGIGTGTVNVGEILAANFPGNSTVTENISLGAIYIQGNLGLINVGSNIVSTPAVSSLTVGSMVDGASSMVLGSIPKMTVMGDFNADLNLIGYQFGSIGKLYIGGSLAADSAGDSDSGQIYFQGHIGSATIGNITGSSVAESNTTSDFTGTLRGESTLPTSIGSLHVLGSITGGTGTGSGRVFAESSIGKVAVDGSVIGGSGQDSGEIAGPLKTVKITGSVTGGSGIDSGVILGELLNGSSTVPVGIGTVTIGGSITGGSAGIAATSSALATPGDSGIISAFSAKSITIMGSLIGGTAASPGTADTSGAILVDSAKSITIGGNIVGGNGPSSGIITGLGDGATSFGSIVIGGSVTGNSGANSGAIVADVGFGGSITNLQIGGNLVGDSVNQPTPLVGSGFIEASHFGTLAIKGNVTSGTNAGGGGIANDGAIRSSGDISSLTILGTVTGSASNPVIISAEQGVSKSKRPTTDLAIQSVNISGAASFLDILAGYGPVVSSGNNAAGAPLGDPTDGSAQIGTVTFHSTLEASNVVAGALPDSAGFFGTGGNTGIGSPAVVGVQSSIASIIVAGQATGDSSPADSYGFVAQQLHLVKVAGTIIPTDTLTLGAPVPVNNTNLYLLEVQ